MKKVLFTASVDRHIELFHIPYLKYFKENGYEVHVATNSDKSILYADKKIKLDMKRNPFSLKNIKAVFQLKKILDSYEYDLIHTHTPIGSVVTRISSALSRKKTKVIYTCHGFHFYKGAPLYYWLLFYPIEKFLMRFIDVLLVMNNEDYNFAQKHFKRCKIFFVHGVGFNKDRLDMKKSNSKIKEIYFNLGIKKSDFVVSYIAEYSSRKRQLDFIKSLNKTDIRNSNIKILFIGDDSLNGKLKRYIDKNNLNSVIKLVSFTDDVNTYYELSDLIISCSRQEGLPLNVVEAIYKKKILLVSNCRGNIDLVKNGVNGFIVKDIGDFYSSICFIKDNFKSIKRNYKQGINILDYSSEIVLKDVVKIYENLLKS